MDEDGDGLGFDSGGFFEIISKDLQDEVSYGPERYLALKSSNNNYDNKNYLWEDNYNANPNG